MLQWVLFYPRRKQSRKGLARTVMEQDGSIRMSHQLAPRRSKL